MTYRKRYILYLATLPISASLAISIATNQIPYRLTSYLRLAKASANTLSFVQFSQTQSPITPIPNIQDPKYRLQARQGTNGQIDRYEGLKAIEIAGERLSLVAVLLNIQSMPRDQSGDIYRLGFFLQQAEPKVKLQVRDYNVFNTEGHYWMLPTRTDYTSGFQEFAWDARLAKSLGIRLEHLGAVAILEGHRSLVIAPLLLHTDPFPTRMQMQGCRFVFMPSETMTVDYRLFPARNEHHTLLESGGNKWYKDQIQILSWNGADSQGSTVQEGKYILQIIASIAVRGKPVERIPYDYEFYYKSEITYQPQKP